jgi:membrane protease YdiL (CAAX protease family)
MLSASAPLAFALIYLLWFVAGAYVYIALVRQIIARRPLLTDVERSTSTPDVTPTFGSVEAILAVILIGLLLINIAAAFSMRASQVSTRGLVSSFIVTFAIIMVVIVTLEVRGRSIVTLGGLTRLGAVRAILTGALLLFFAYPLLNTAELILQRFYGSGFSNQSIVDFFNGSQTLRERITVIIFAVALAPLSEEFLFRFFLYGVLRRYFGIAFGLIANSLLFAAAHGHLPSFPLLFILGVCFTIAYEWSGSLLVTMTMHSLFNSSSLVVLAFPQLSSP